MHVRKSDSEAYFKAFNTAEGLGRTVRRLIQEVEVLKTMLKETGHWDEARYRQGITGQFLHDHNSAGAGINSTAYQYTWDESTFLQRCLGASEDEIKEFERQVAEAQSLT